MNRHNNGRKITPAARKIYGTIYMEYVINPDLSYAKLATNYNWTRQRIHQIITRVTRALETIFDIDTHCKEWREDLTQASILRISKKVEYWVKEGDQ